MRKYLHLHATSRDRCMRDTESEMTGGKIAGQDIQNDIPKMSIQLAAMQR
jgi:hypothetical protein